MIVGIKNNSVLNFEIEIEANHIKAYFKKGELHKIEEFIKSFNEADWETKTNNLISEDDTDENVIREKIKEFIEKETDLDLFSFDDLVFTEESIDRIRDYKGKSIEIVDNMKYFTNRILPAEVLNMIADFTENIEPLSIEDVPLSTFLPGVSEYVLYMGPNEKYRGCIGKIVKTRDKAASQLVEFPNKFRESGNIARFWSKPQNLVNFLKEE